ncbi:MAG: zinc-dependent metalloprotease [Planctomycetes bacterium]|nr:zinc-dependent metalloprotease [Planctomycetota bacterium]
MQTLRSFALALLAGGALMPAVPALTAPAEEAKSDYPPFEKVVDGLEKVVSTTDGSTPLYDLYADTQKGKLLAVLPNGFADQLLMIACTVSGGHPEAGVMGPTYYVKWRQIGKQLALVAPNLSVRTEGGKQAEESVGELFTGRVLLSMPIVGMAPGNRPVFDFGAMATQKVMSFFDPRAPGGYGPSMAPLDVSLATLTKAKAFPHNVVVEYEAPRVDGQLVRVAYSLGKLEGSPGFKPRVADARVGFFYDWYLDYAKQSADEVAQRYISRWNLEKADPSLAMSPVKQPVTWYIEHTTPIRYRRYVRDGILMWNKAFEKLGLLGAMEVFQQDSDTGAHMDKDPEDARYNFFRWNTSDEGYAIGPSRTNPLTGEILDADIVWNQGLTRGVRGGFANLTEELGQETFAPETLAFFEQHPSWDPRLRLSDAATREQLVRRLGAEAADAVALDLHDAEHPWTMGARDRTNQACRIGNRLSMDIGLAAAAFDTGLLAASDGPSLDGVPEEFLGPMIRYIAAHEVGHTLGLQHNMAASTYHTLGELNSEGFEGPTIASVMDYAAPNINYENGPVQGPYATPCVGPYDDWAIRFGYGPESERDEVLSEVSKPEHVYVSQIAMSTGSDPRNMTWDLGAHNLDFCESRLKLVGELRGKLIDEIVQKGDSWSKLRRRYASLLGTHVQALFAASKWIGGAYENQDFKGDPGDRAPIEDVAPADQRHALKLIVDHAFRDEAFGLTPELVRHMGKEYWWDPSGEDELMDDASFTVHEAVGGVQALGLSLLLNPTTLRRVYDAEYRAGEDGDALTVAEIVKSVTAAVWDGPTSSFRRNLQREHVERLIDLALLGDTSSPVLRTIGSLATEELRGIDARASKGGGDAYTKAHLADVHARITKALDAAYVIER